MFKCLESQIKNRRDDVAAGLLVNGFKPTSRFVLLIMAFVARRR